MSVVPGRQCADLVWPLQIELQLPSHPSISSDRGPLHGFFSLLVARLQVCHRVVGQLFENVEVGTEIQVFFRRMGFAENLRGRFVYGTH